MSIKVSELMNWLNTLKPDDLVWVDDYGLTLESNDGIYLEVGGKIEFYDEDTKDFWK